MLSSQDLNQAGWAVRRHPIVYYVFATILIVSFLRLGSDLLIPVVFAALISLTLSPAIERLERWQIPSQVAALAVLTGATALAASVMWFLTIQIASLVTDTSSYSQHFTEKVDHLLQIAGEMLERVGIRARLASWEKLRGWWKTSGQQSLLEVAGNVLYGLRIPLGHFLGVYLLTFFLLLDRKRVRDRLYSLLGKKRLFSATVAIADATEKIQRYLLAQGTINCACAVAAGVLCHLLSIPQPYLWGLLIGICRYVPFIGFWVAAAIPVALCIVVHDGWSTAVTAIACFAALEIVFANLLEPHFIGRSVGLSTIGVICAAVFWGWVWGIPGVILGVPLTITLATLGKSIPQLQFLPVLVGEEVQGDAQLHFIHRLLVGDEVSVAEQIRQGFDKLGGMVMLTEIALPSLAEIHKLGLPPNDRINGNVKRALRGLSAETDNLRSSGAPLLNLSPATVLVVSSDRRDTGLLASSLCSLLSTMGARSSEVPASGLVSEIAEICRKDPAGMPALVVPIISVDDTNPSYRFLKRFLSIDRAPAQLVVFLDPAVNSSEALALLLADDRIRVVDRWDRLMEFCHEIALSDRLSRAAG